MHNVMGTDLLPYVQRFDEVRRAVGERAMFVCDADVLTYVEADEESARVYRYLKERGIGREAFVHVFMPRGVHFFSCMLGVWKAGAAFILTDDMYPTERVTFMRKDVGAELVLDQSLFEHIMRTCEPLEGWEDTDVHDAAYAVYTSGSTGNPKGVLHEYGNVDQCAAQVPRQSDYPPHNNGFVPPLHFVAAVMAVVMRSLTGATMHVVSGALLRDYPAFTRFVEEKRLDSVYLPPSYLRLYKQPSASLKSVSTGSEPANGLYYPGGKPAIVNTYGMSEAGFFVLQKELEAAYDVAPVGKPCLPIALRLIDDEGRVVEGPGQGELCFENEYVRGYINLPDLTAKAFRDGMYYTGDICRRDETGDYYVVGRNDDMIKINGNRIEPAEIEAAVRHLTGLVQVAARGFDEGGRAYICVYYMRSEAQDLGILAEEKGEELLALDHDALAAMLPSYMRPTYYVGLESFPINANGKLQRRELPAPKQAADDTGRTYVAPATDAEAYLCQKMAEVLGLDRVGATEDFYLIGGDSLSCIELVTACDELPLTAADIFELRTPQRLCAKYGLSGAHGDDAAADALEAEAESMVLPLLLTQEQHIYLQLTAPNSCFLNMCDQWELAPDVDVERLVRAVDATLAAHPALLTRYSRRSDGVYVQRHDASLFCPCRRVRLTEDEWQKTLATINRPFELFDSRLYECALYQTERASYLFFNVHHAIADGFSLHLLIDEFYERYADEAYRPAPDRYFSLVRELTAAASGEEAELVGAHFDETYLLREGFDACPLWLKPDHEDDGRANGVMMDLEAFERREGRTPTLFMAAALVALARCNESAQAMISSVYGTRDDRQRMAAAGILLTPVVVYARVDAGTRPAELLASLEEQQRYATAHPAVPLAARFDRSADITRFLYQKDMVMAGTKMDALAARTLRVDVNDVMTGTLSVAIVDNTGADRLGLAVRYDASRYEEEHVRRFVALMREAVDWLGGE